MMFNVDYGLRGTQIVAFTTISDAASCTACFNDWRCFAWTRQQSPSSICYLYPFQGWDASRWVSYGGRVIGRSPRYSGRYGQVVLLDSADLSQSFLRAHSGPWLWTVGGIAHTGSTLNPQTSILIINAAVLSD
jgi:hypothetical protein